MFATAQETIDTPKKRGLSPISCESGKYQKLLMAGALLRVVPVAGVSLELEFAGERSRVKS
jgi:hypothetical protein